MNRVFSGRFVLLLVLMSLLSFTCPAVRAKATAAGDAAPAPEAQEASSPAPDPNVGPAAAQPGSVVVARIGDYAITRDELRDRLLQEIRPREEDIIEEAEPVTAETTLRKMLAEKAMMMEGRRLGYLEDEMIRTSIERSERQQLIRLLLENYLREHMSVDEAEVTRAREANPKLTPEQARTAVQRATASRVLDKFYSGLLEKYQVKKVKENLAEAAKVHERLLNRPAQPRGRGEFWIKNSQVRNELSEQEKALVLATYEGGQFTLYEWFQALSSIVPPRRPTDLNAPEGVEKLLDRALQGPILAAEARARGYDKDQQLRSRIRELEDQRLLYKVQEEKTKDIEEPNAVQIKAYFESNQGKFADPPSLKVDQVWCEDLPTAEKARKMLDEGADFAAVKSDHSLQKGVEPHSVYPGGEGLFWAELWKAEPNQVVGPIRGFYSDGVRWRVVKVLERTPAKVPPYSEQLASRVKWAMISRRRQEVLDNYQKELLEKYAHEIFLERIKEMDPLELAMQRDRK